MKVIARHQENITLNPYEFVCDADGRVKIFKTDEEAINFLNKNTDICQDKEAWSEEGIYILNYDDCFKNMINFDSRLN